MESLTILKGDKDSVYESLLPQILALTEGEQDPIANMANISAALKRHLAFGGLVFIL